MSPMKGRHHSFLACKKKVLLGYKPHPDYETTYSMSPITSLPLLRNSTFYQPGILPAALLGRTLDVRMMIPRTFQSRQTIEWRGNDG